MSAQFDFVAQNWVEPVELDELADLPDCFFDDDHTEPPDLQEVIDPQTGFVERMEP